MANLIESLGRLFRRKQEATGTVYAERIQSYMLNEQYYNNTVYGTQSNGGQREFINEALGHNLAADLAGIYNPVARAVNLYQHVFGGKFGTDILVEADNKALLDPINRIWKWSNINVRKQNICLLGPMHGNVGLRIVARDDPDPLYRRVYIKPEHPKIIVDLETDDRGNIKRILFQYKMLEGLADKQEVITIREEMTQEVFRTWRIDDRGDAIPFDTFNMSDRGRLSEQENRLGLVPYVLLSHTPSDETWSNNAFYRQLQPIDRLNALAVHINTQIHRHVRTKWLVAAAGEPPEEMDLDDLSVVYINTRNTVGSPLVSPLVSNLSLQDAIAQSREILGQIEDNLPEIKATSGKFLSGQSGESVAQLRQPAEDNIALARINYEDAMVRAQQIGVSWGILFDMWDVGTGQGNLAAAESAFHTGAEDHTFNIRDLLPASPLERSAIATNMGQDGSRKERLRVRGYTEQRIDQIEAEYEAEEAKRIERVGKEEKLKQAAKPKTQPQNPQNPQNGNSENSGNSED